MLIKIGPQAEPSGIVDLLLACHDRIRFFTAAGLRLAEASAPSEEDIRDTAERLLRYFSESLPLHVADEEQTILPRLSGLQPEIDQRLDAMHREHRQHQPYLDRLLEYCRILKERPERLPALREGLALVARQLEVQFAAHLKEEEAVVLPAIQSLLSPEDREAMLREFRARRSA